MKKALAIAHLIALALLLIGLSNCRPKPEDHLKKAQEALAQENSDLALQFYQRAYEESLPDDFFVKDRDTSYYLLQVSVNNNWLILLRKEKGEGADAYHLYLKDIEKEDDWQEQLPMRTDKVQLSPNGKFALFTAKEKNACRHFAWQTQREKFFEDLPLPNTCLHSPAISDSGQILYMKEGKIGSYQVQTKVDSFPYMKKFPDKPLSKLPAWAYFTFSPNNIAYLAYGALGSYKLYNLHNKTLTLLSRAGSYSKVFFMQGKDNPAYITGGAGKRQMVIYEGTVFGKTLHSFSIKSWLEAAFIKKDAYYFLQGNKLLLVKDKKLSELPFWASQIHTDKNNHLYFLSQLGTAMVYRGKEGGAQSKAIFEKGWDLYESSL